MKKDMLAFCKSYNDKLISDNDIKHNPDKVNKHPGIDFYILTTGSSYEPTIFKIDDEDLRYLYKKYSSILMAEITKNVDSIKKRTS